MTKIIFVLTAIIILSGCVVSKKKYDALLSENDQLTNNLSKKTTENKKLQTNLEQAIGDYEVMKADFSTSNALKSDNISDLMIKVTHLKEESEALNAKLNETVNKFKEEEDASYLANEELELTLKTISNLKRDTANLNRSLQMAKQRNILLQDELKTSQEKLSASGYKRVEVQKELDKQSKQLNEMEMQLVKSQQNISDISKSFIELRKKLLKAKSSNQPLDPNNNKNIDRIAKLLGHY